MNKFQPFINIADRFVARTTQKLPMCFEVDIAMALHDYHYNVQALNLDAMLSSDDLYSLSHDISGIMNNESCFLPRFAVSN